jgi:hypothetical protein
MRSFLCALISVAALASLAGDAIAVDELNCVNYYVHVLNQKHDAALMGCPVDTSAPQWSDKSRDHYEARLQAADQDVLASACECGD